MVCQSLSFALVRSVVEEWGGDGVVDGDGDIVADDM